MASFQARLLAAQKRATPELFTSPPKPAKKQEKKVSFKEMWQLVDMHFEEAFAAANCFDDSSVWDIPTYLIENEPGWTWSELEWLCDRYHNGPTSCR